MKHLIAIFAVCAITAGCFGTVTNSEVDAGTVLLDDCTSKSRVVWDAYLNASSRVDSLIQTVSPKADFSTNNGELVSTIGVSITNLQNRLTSGSADEGLVVYKALHAELAESAIEAGSADTAGSAGVANSAIYAQNIGEEYSDHRSASSVLNSIDANSNSIQVVSKIAIETAMSITNKIPIMPWKVMSSPYGSPNISGAFVQWKSTGWDVMANIPAYGTQSIVNSPRGKIDDLEVRWNPNEWAYGNDEYSLVIVRSYTNALGFTSPDAYVQWTKDINNNYTSLTVGRRAGNTGPNTFAVGYDVQTPGSYSIALGNQTEASAYMSMALGSRSKSTNSVAYTWSGTGNTVKYGSHGVGTYNIDPSNGALGFWIGNKNLYEIFSEWITASSETNMAFTVAHDNEDGSVTMTDKTITPIDVITKDELDTAIENIHIPDPDLSNYAKKSELASVSNDAQVIYRLFSGSNVIDVVTNYNSQTKIPTRKLYQLTETNTYQLVWDEERRHANTLSNANQYAESLGTNYAPRAWSRTTSGLGAEAPEGTTWISSPLTVIAGGYEYEKHFTSGGAIWLLTSNGSTFDFSPNTNNVAFLNIAATDGTPIFRIEKTDSYLIGVNASGVSTEEPSTLVVELDVVASEHPLVRVCSNIRDRDWQKEEDGISSSLATVTWSGSPGAWICRVQNNTGGNSIFAYFEYLQEGGVKIVNEGQVDLTQGIIVNGVKFAPTISGSSPNRTLTWTEVQ